MQLHNYFAETSPAKWSVTSFLRFHSSLPSPPQPTSSTSSHQEARRQFSDQLSKILARHTPYESSPREWRTTAAKLKTTEGKRKKKKRTESRRTTSATQGITIHNDPMVAGSVINSSFSVTSKMSPTPSSLCYSTYEESTLPPETPLLAGHALTIGTLLKDLRQAPPSAATLKLITEVEQGVVFVRHVAKFLPKELQIDVRRMLRKLEPVPSGVARCISAHADIEAMASRTTSAASTSETTDIIDNTVATIINDAQFFHMNLSKLLSLAPITGETWLVVNVWGRLLDSIFLQSNTVFINRSELVPHSCPNLKCDGLILPIAPPLTLHRYGVRQLELGFVEVKPMRPLSIGWESDESKLLKLMRASLLSLMGMGSALDAGTFVVVGVLCVGFQLRVYRARSTSTGGICFFGEDSAFLEPEDVGSVMQLAWQVKATVERSYHTVLEALMDSSSGEDEEDKDNDKEDEQDTDST